MNPDASLRSVLDGTGPSDLAIAAATAVLLIVLHEIVHAAAWSWTASLKRSDIAFGCDWKTLTPYAHARVPMSATAYRIGATAPAIEFF